MPYFTTQAGTDIYYEEFGEPGKVPVLLLHGLASSWEIWHPQILEFKEHFHVFAIDLPGHGKSGRQKEYTVHDLPSVILDFINLKNIEQINVLGLSVGTTGAVLFALEHPERVSSLVLQGPAAGIVSLKSPAGWLGAVQLAFTIYGVFALWATIGKPAAGKVINWIGKTYQFSALLTGMEEQVDKRAMVGYGFSNADNPYQDRLTEIHKPVLILRGLEDQFPRKLSKVIKDNVKGPCFWLEMPEAQHLVALEKPIEFNMAATAFLVRVQKADSLSVTDAAKLWKSRQGIKRAH